jgi:hypothetical protein
LSRFSRKAVMAATSARVMTTAVDFGVAHLDCARFYETVIAPDDGGLKGVENLLLKVA